MSCRLVAIACTLLLLGGQGQAAAAPSDQPVPTIAPLVNLPPFPYPADVPVVELPAEIPPGWL